MIGFFAMSKQSRNFSAKFKPELYNRLLMGEKDLNTLVTENNIHSNLFRSLKKEIFMKLQ